MRYINKQQQNGFSLLEMLLVIVVVTSIVFMASGYMRRQMFESAMTRTSMQMQLLLNAGAAYYVANNAWPSNLAAMSPEFIPTATEKSPWGTDYTVFSNNQSFYVIIPLAANTAALALSRANQVAGRVPSGFVNGSANPETISSCSTATCYVIGQISIPAQVLNKALGMDFAGLFHHGACVPVPKCKVAGMTPQVFIVPISVSGVNDNTTAGTAPNAYPISSYTAYATASAPLNSTPPKCSTLSTTAPACPLDGSVTNKYWRACVDIVTERGNVAETRTDTDAANYWGQSVTLGAFTRCAGSVEPSGSDTSVYTN